MLRDETEEIQKIFVGDPKRMGDKFVYMVKGFDN